MSTENNRKKSNYDRFKQEALERFLSFDQTKLIQRLQLDADDTYIYTEFCMRLYRMNRTVPCLEWTDVSDRKNWYDADPNETLTICDLLCHTDQPLVPSGDYVSLISLNRVKSGTTSVTLGSDLFKNIAAVFDGHGDALCAACEGLGGVAVGKGDVAYEIPLHGPVHVRISYYHSDDEFPPVMTVFFQENICEFLHYETLYYLVHVLLNRLSNYVNTFVKRED